MSDNGTSDKNPNDWDPNDRDPNDRGTGADEDDERFDDEDLDEEELDDEDEPYESTPRVHPAIFAKNWRTVLVVDGAVGVAILVVGVSLAIAWNPFVGGFIGSLGLVYVAFVVRRGQDWARQRREAGYS